MKLWLIYGMSVVAYNILLLMLHLIEIHVNNSFAMFKRISFEIDKSLN